jgi:membrane-associated protease RseP (regulator of RpoE activity)
VKRAAFGEGASMRTSNRVRMGVMTAAVLAWSWAVPLRAGEPGDAHPRVQERRGWKELAGASPFLGISLLDLTADLRAHFGAPKGSGVLVSGVTPDSPASRVGISVGDVITRVDGDSVESFWDVSRSLRGKKKGDKVEIELVRDRAVKKLTATVDERPDWPGTMIGQGLASKKLLLDNPERTIVIDGEPLERMEEFFKSPEWKMRLGNVDECERVRARLEAVEERLRSLEQKLPGK